MARLMIGAGLPRRWPARLSPSSRRRRRAAPARCPPDYGPPITNEQAKAAAAAAFAEAKKNNWRMAFAIVGPGGELVYFEKMDGTQLGSTEMPAARRAPPCSTGVRARLLPINMRRAIPRSRPFPEQPVASEGGVPIIDNGKIIGAIGASGGTGQQDGVAAAAAAGAVK